VNKQARKLKLNENGEPYTVRIDKCDKTYAVLRWDKKSQTYVLDKCVACGKPLRYRKSTGCNLHNCPPKTEAARKSANTRGEEPLMRESSFGQRLADGFAMLDPDDWGEGDDDE
jgi:hypothetical protein